MSHDRKRWRFECDITTTEEWQHFMAIPQKKIWEKILGKVSLNLLHSKWAGESFCVYDSAALNCPHTKSIDLFDREVQMHLPKMKKNVLIY